MHLNSRDLIKSEICNFCGKSFSKNSSSKIILQQNPLVKMVECKYCLLVSADHYPNEKYLKHLYNGKLEQRISHLSHSSYLTNVLARYIAKCIEKYFFTEFDKLAEISILDFGGAEGNLLTVLKKNIKKIFPKLKINLYVSDFEDKVNNESLKYISFDKLQYYNFDIIIANAVLEHICNLSQVFKMFSITSKKSTLFYARVPFDLPVAKVIKSYNIEWPYHVHDFSPIFFEKLNLHNANFKLLESHTCFVSSTFNDGIFRTLSAMILKIPSLIETKVIKPLFDYEGVFYKFVGGWQIVGIINRNKK